MKPRLLNEDAAKELLGGALPGNLIPPMRIGGRKLWDRIALEKRLDEMSGINRDDSPKHTKQISPLDEWMQENGQD